MRTLTLVPAAVLRTRVGRGFQAFRGTLHSAPTLDAESGVAFPERGFRIYISEENRPCLRYLCTLQ